MCPGLTHPNAKMTAVGENTVVAIMAEGKDHALAIGKTVMSTQVTLKRALLNDVTQIGRFFDSLCRSINAIIPT